MKPLRAAFYSCTFIFLAAAAALAQPANDNFANAWTLTGTSVTTNGNTGQAFLGFPNATTQDGEPNHAGFNGGRSVWFNWTAPAGGNVIIDTLGSAFNTLLAVYTGNAVNALTQVAANNDLGGGTNQSLVQFLVVPGTTYRIAVDGRSTQNSNNPASGPYVLHLNMSASLTITAPANGSLVAAGVPITISATAALIPSPVTRVDFYRNGNLIGTDPVSPYSFTDLNPPLGTNFYSVIGVDNTGQNWPSAQVRVVVVNPGVLVTAPVDGTTFLSTSPINVAAVGVLATGSMTNLEFLVDNQKFAEDATTPFGASWNTVTPGVHRFTAVGKADSGTSYTSAPVFVSVARLLMTSNSTWSYLDTGTDPGPGWAAPAFDDSAWAAGPAPLGYGDSSGRLPLTVNNFGPDANNKYVTTYYRQSLVVNNIAGYTNLLVRLERDDGVIVYLNGTEIFRNNMPNGPVSSTTLASANANDDGTSISVVTVPANLLVEGPNSVAAEVHQDAVTSSDIWFVMELSGVHSIPRNIPPVLALLSPTNNAHFLDPGGISLEATAFDPDADGRVTKVEFFVDNVKLGEATVEPYTFPWDNTPIGPHLITAIATDNNGAASPVASASVTVYDGFGTPVVFVSVPVDGAVFDGPTNLTLAAFANSPEGITRVQFLTNGVLLATLTVPPYTLTWTNAAFGTNTLVAVATDETAREVASSPITIFVRPPPPNIAAPVVARANPTPGSSLSSLTNLQITFSERVIGVEAADLLVGGVSAVGVTGSGSNYTFTVRTPPLGVAAVTWAAGHGIVDVGFPPLPFDATGAGATWSYQIVDGTAPTISARDPVAGATVSSLSQVTVTFSEPVSGVEASDFLVNGTPAFGLSALGGSNYTFAFSQPAPGPVDIRWATTHGIGDLATSPNAFNATGPGATWSYTLDNRTVLVESNATWRFVKGTAEASAPSDAWRWPGFDDTGWSNSTAPFYYGDPYAYTNGPTVFGTLLSDMQGVSGYASVYLRKTFLLPNAAAATNLLLNAQSDDGFIAWINGVEVLRFNMPAGDIPYNGQASTAIAEANNRGAPYTFYTLLDPSYLVDGTNILAVHAFNNQPTTSSDFGFNTQLYTYLVDPSVVPPRVAEVTPLAGNLFALSNLTVRFSEPVEGVDARDLLLNGRPALSLTSTTNTIYTFGFVQPPYGAVAVTWDPGHGIEDFDVPAKPFDGNAAGSSFNYTLLNPSAPTVALQVPMAAATVNELNQITITFSEPVSGVDAPDLRINGLSAGSVSGGPATYTFTFAQPPFGVVNIGWASGHGITDTELAANPFDSTRPGNLWSYTLVDQTRPVLALITPPAGANVTNLTSLSVTFSESVTGVNATDLLLNGIPATGLSGSGAGPYTFSFAQPNAVVIQVSWAVAHGIRDLAAAPNPFDSTAPGAAWSYLTPDNVPPSVANIDPPAGVTVRSLTSIRVLFTETVVGVTTNSLLINNVRPHLLAGSGAGPYTFTFFPPPNGPVDVRWAQSQGITDLATPANRFAGGEFTYQLEPGASFAGKVLINEIMFNPYGGHTSNEWVELRNLSTNLINLTGWRFSKGLDFTFPNVAIPAGGYLVVAADVAAFRIKYPGVNNVLGGWRGSLANGGENIELQTPLGETVANVRYAAEGDWGRRQQGNGSEPVTRLTRNGTTATATIFQHNLSGNNDQVLISGADQPEYNGRFVVNGITPTTFNFPVTGAPVTPATGNIISRWLVDDGSTGWSWFNPANGFGSSLELMNPALPAGAGQNWAASSTPSGTPGFVNSTATNNLAPLITEVMHSPAVPRSTQAVTITARVRDELSNGVSAVTLFYRDHTVPGGAANPFSSRPMLDNGNNGDGLANDGLFGVMLPPQTNGTVIEFYVQAGDVSGRLRTWPAPALGTNGVPGQIANALFQIDDEVISEPMPVLRVVMTGSERAFLQQNGTINSDSAMNLTLISADGDGTKVRYCCDGRIRGAGSRGRNPKNNRIDIPGDNLWNGLSAINLNSLFVHAQLVGNNLAIKAGVPTEMARVVQYRINGVNPAPLTAPQNGSGNGGGYGSFLLLEPPNGDLAEDLFPQDSNGNWYRASTGNHNADLSYQNGNPAAYLGRGYYKTSNRTENDWTDMASLTFAFEQVANDADYVQAISTNVNVAAWMRFFALGSLLNYGETSLFNGIGDDYALYRGEADRRFVLVGHDFDTIFGQGDTGANYYPISTNSSIFIMLNPPNGNANVTLLRRFMTNAAFAPIFYAELKKLCDTTFHPANLNPFINQLLSGWGNGPTVTTISDMQTWANNRRSIALSQIPLALTVAHPLNTISNNLPYTTAGVVALSGAAHAIDTRRVLVNGAQANWSAFNASWTMDTPLRPGLNHVLVQSLNSNDVEFARATLDIWYDDGSVASAAGAIATDTVWTPAAGPYMVTANLTVNAGTTLTILPGTTVYLGAGVDVTVASGGRILAEGLDTAQIHFAAAPGVGSWGGITVSGGAGSPESRFAYVHFEGNDGTALHGAGAELFLDHLTFGNAARQYVSLDGCSFVVQNCVFPATTAGFEPVHGTQGIKTGGRGIFRRNFWGRVQGYNDACDFTAGNRPGPIVQFYHNVFMGSDDDLLDLDSTDAWVEGNIFLHAHRNGSPDSASAISGGSDNAQNSQITILGNLFFDCDQAANAKQTNFYTLLNNTIVHQSRVGSQDTNAAVIILADEGTSQGQGVYLEGNIIYDAENLTRNVTTALVTFTNNIITLLQGAPWSGPGGNNSNVDPLFHKVPRLDETTSFKTWEEAQVLWEWFSLRPGSPAVATGPNGRDKGAVIPSGASLSGEPVGVSPFTTALLRVGPLITGSGVPSNGFPNGSGFTVYRWRLDAGPWSPETSVATPILLTGVANGSHFVEISGRNDAGFFQDDPVFGSDASVTVSRTWTVSPNASPLRLNEILASNSGALVNSNTTPDAVELHNPGSIPLDLSGVGLSDDPADPAKFLFPLNTTLAAGAYLTVFANSPDGTPGFHLGFNLNQSGDALYLFDSAANGGALIDSVSFGMQLDNLSIGRLADGTWALNVPSFGGPNQAAPTGDPSRLRLNEWLALGTAPFFVELYNPDPAAVALGGLYLSDEIMGWPDRHRIAALSFMGGNGYLRFLADSAPEQGAEHLNFSLNPDQGTLGLFAADLTAIDCLMIPPQRPNRSQGRSPNGSSAIVFFDTPTPGAPNPLVTGPEPNGNALVLNEVLASNASLSENPVATGSITPDWIELYNGTVTTTNLSDLSLTDDTQQPRKFVFAPGTLLAPGAYLRVLCDSGNTNRLPLLATNFSLRASGGGVYLFDSRANGGSLLNSILYGLQTPDLSIGRVPDGSTNWVLTAPTPNARNSAVTSFGNAADLRINEWLANPIQGNDDWFEIYNPGSRPVVLGGLFLSDDLNDPDKHIIAALSFLGSGTNAFQRFIADGNTGAGADHVGFSLRAAGEAIGLSYPSGGLIDGVIFGQQTEEVTQGRFPDGSATIVDFPGTDSPGDSNWRWLTNVVINETLTHTDEPLEDAIELHNFTGTAVDVGGWWLSDDNGYRQKYQIPSPTLIPPYGFAVIYETHFTNDVEAAYPFALSSGGDETVLSAADNGALNGYRTRVRFGAAANAVSFGRYVTSDGRSEFVAMAARTFGMDDPSNVDQFRTGGGLTNSYPRVGPVVISEILYHPPAIGTNDNVVDEFIELHNITTAAVPLYDPANPANTWRLRDGVDFDFPPNTLLGPGEYLLVVSFDPVNNPAELAAFRSKYSVAPGTSVLGPWSGRLANDDEDIELRRPDTPNLNEVPYVLVEHVRYFDTFPWPTLADGTGFSLQRVSDTGYGNDPTNWTAAAPSPGPAGSSTDTDGDGMPDTWELAYALDPFNPLDAGFDSDGDGLTNLQEYQSGSDPRDVRSGLAITSILLVADEHRVTLTFTAFANQSYTVEATDSLVGLWQPLQDVAATPTTHVVEISVPMTGSERCFRLRTPWRFAENAELRIESIELLPGNQVRLSFTALANQPCAVEFRATLNSGGAWSGLTNYPAAPDARRIELVAPAPGAGGFYRLRSP